MSELVEKKSIADVLADANCYIGNLNELLADLQTVLVEDEDGVVRVDFNDAVKIIQVVWDAVKETADECADKQIVVKLPEGLPGQLVAALLAIIGV